MRPAKIQIRIFTGHILDSQLGNWSESSLGAHVRRYVFLSLWHSYKFTLHHSLSLFSRQQVGHFFFIFPSQKDLTFHANCLHRRQFAWNVITKTCLYNFDPLKPHFYIQKLGFTGVYIIFLFMLKNIDCGYLLEPPRRGGSNGYPQSMFWVEIWKISKFFIWNCQFLEVKFSMYLDKRFFVMSKDVLWKKKMKNISIGRLLRIWPSMLSIICDTD